MKAKISGYATAEGTESYASKALSQGKVVRSHFKQFDGLTFTSLGMGTYLGSLDSRDDEEMESAIKQSIRSGAINVIDTAINYRLQKSEKCVGRALRSLIEQDLVTREQVFVSTKNGYLALDADHKRGYGKYIADELLAKGIIDVKDIVGSSHCMTIPFLKHELDRSLKNLGFETIDLIYLHNSAESQLVEVPKQDYFERLKDAFSFYETARADGKIRYYGLATWNCFRNNPSERDYLNLEDVVFLAEEAGGKEHGFRFIQFPYNIGMPEALVKRNQVVQNEDITLLEACEHYRIGVFTSVPLMQGKLLNYELPKLDGLTKVQVSIQFARSSNGVIAPLVGHKLSAHVKENIQIAETMPLEDSEFAAVFRVGSGA